LADLAEGHVLVVGFSSGCGDRELEVRRLGGAVGVLVGEGGGVGVHRLADGLEEVEELATLRGVLRVLPVDVDAWSDLLVRLQNLLSE
jgi:hypothetical protein